MKWNYKVLAFNLSKVKLSANVPAEAEEIMWSMNDLGNDGWELVSSSTFRSLRPPGDKLLVLLKKRVS